MRIWFIRNAGESVDPKGQVWYKTLFYRVAAGRWRLKGHIWTEWLSRFLCRHDLHRTAEFDGRPLICMCCGQKGHPLALSALAEHISSCCRGNPVRIHHLGFGLCKVCGKVKMFVDYEEYEVSDVDNE